MITNIVIGGMQKHQKISNDGICSCLTAAMGMGWYIPMVVELIPCKYNKWSNGGYIKQNQASVRDLYNKVASSVTAHYWRGISCNGDNIVIVKYE